MSVYGTPSWIVLFLLSYSFMQTCIDIFYPSFSLSSIFFFFFSIILLLPGLLSLYSLLCFYHMYMFLCIFFSTLPFGRAKKKILFWISPFTSWVVADKRGLCIAKKKGEKNADQFAICRYRPKTTRNYVMQKSCSVSSLKLPLIEGKKKKYTFIVLYCFAFSREGKFQVFYEG